MRRHGWYWAALAVALASGSAQAQPEESPQVLYRQGVAAFQVRDFTTALTQFQRAYVRSARPELLMNVALTFQELGRPRDAIATFRQYLSAVPTASNRAEVESRIAALERSVSADPPRTPTPAPTPTPTPAPAPPTTGPIVRVSVDRTPHPPGTDAPPAPHPLWPWVTLGGGALLAVGGLIALAAPRDPGQDRGVVTETEYLSDRDTRATVQTTGAVLLGVGLAGVTAGVIGLLTRSTSRPAVIDAR